MKILITQRSDLGRTDDWAAEAEGLPHKGIGRSLNEAASSLMFANLAAFGVEQVTQDVLSVERDTKGQAIRKAFVWKKREG